MMPTIESSGTAPRLRGVPRAELREAAFDDYEGIAALQLRYGLVAKAQEECKALGRKPRMEGVGTQIADRVGA